jgi:hypothetical protein
MRFYSDIPARRAQQVARDVLVVLVLCLLAWLAMKVHDEVARLAEVGRGVTSAGNAVQDGFGRAGAAVGGVPLVGDRLSGALRDAGRGAGRPVTDAGRTGEDAALDLATLLGVLVFFLPAAGLLSSYVPTRINEAQRLGRASRALAGALDEPERERLVAMRAAFGLPWEELMRKTPDPLGDLAAGRHDALIAAALEYDGLARAPVRVGVRPRGR